VLIKLLSIKLKENLYSGYLDPCNMSISVRTILYLNS